MATMLKTTALAGLLCAVALTAPAMAQHYLWSGGVSGAIGGYTIFDTTPAGNASLLALSFDRMAYVTGDDFVEFDRVIPHGSAPMMRRMTDPKAQTPAMKRREEARATRQAAKSEKQACESGDENIRTECRQERREIKQFERHAARDIANWNLPPHYPR